jgi:hypothetical protein
MAERSLKPRTDRWFEREPDEAAPGSWGLAGHRSRMPLMRLDAAGGITWARRTNSSLDAALVLRGGCSRDGHARTGVIEVARKPNGRWEEEQPIPLPAYFLPVGRVGYVVIEKGERIWITGATPSGRRVELVERCIGEDSWTPRGTVESLSAFGVEAPSVVHDEDGYKLWYAPRHRGRHHIFVSRSNDGRDWKKPELALAGGAFGEADSEGAAQPWVVHHRGRYVMVYRGAPANCLLWATSSDGVAWTKCGCLLFRGSAGAPDECELAWPCLATTFEEDSSFRLAYAGRSAAGTWCLLETDVDMNRASQAAEYAPAATTLERMRAVLRSPDQRHLELRLGPAKHGEPFVALAGVRQLFPSSTPVFEVRTGTHAEIVKVGRSSAFIEREYDRGILLDDHLPIVPRALRYIDDRAVLIMPSISGGTLSEITKRDRQLFDRFVGELVSRTADAMAATLQPFDPQRIDFSTQTPMLLLQRFCLLLDDAVQLPIPSALRTPLVINGSRCPLTIRQAAKGACEEFLRPPQWLVYFETDLKFEHFLYDNRRERLLAIDSEYAGWTDPNWVLATLLFAILSESGSTPELQLAVTKRQVRIDANLGWGAEALADGWVVDRVRDARVPIDTNRTLACALALLTDRWVSPYPDLERRAAVAWFGSFVGAFYEAP